jgi:hypothetical protein
VGHVALIGETLHAYKITIGKPEEKTADLDVNGRMILK